MTLTPKQMVRAIEHGWPGDNFKWTYHHIEADPYSGLVWLDQVAPKPSEAEIEAAWDEIKNDPEPAPPLPSITRYQFKTQLAEQPGAKAQIETFFNGLSAKNKELAQAYYNDRSTFRATDPLMVQIKTTLSLTDQQFETFWRAAMAVQS